MPFRRRQTPFVSALVLALALSACETVSAVLPGGGDSSEGEPAAETGQVVEIISPEPETAEQPAPPASEPPEPAADELAALPPEPAIDDDPQQLIGMGPASLNAFLGPPELIRREAPASLWHYRAEGCVLDVVLYPDRGGDKVTYLEAREGGATKIAPRLCLNKLLRARHGLPG